MKAIFSPGPSYHDPQVREVAGWVRIFDLYREALEELGYEVFIPQVPPELIDQSSTVAKITSYDLYCATQLPLDADLFLGPPGYSLAQIMRLRGARDAGYEFIQHPGSGARGHSRIFLYVFNNADWYRDEMLAPEYQAARRPYDLSPTWRWINQSAVELADHVIAPSPFVKRTWSRLVPEEKISHAFWGVDSQIFSPPPEEPPGFRVLFVGGDPIRKGLTYLLKAFGTLPGWPDDTELWIVGCQVKGYIPRVKGLGMVPHQDMPDIYRQFHVLVLPTLEDGIALCVQEAMASGLVPVATEDPAEVFNNGVSGVKIPYRDPDAVKQALTMLRDNPERRREMARAARALAEQQTWEKMKEDVKEIIRRVMGGGDLPYESPMPWLEGAL